MNYDSKLNYENALKYVVDRFAGMKDKAGYPAVLHSISVSIRVKEMFEFANPHFSYINHTKPTTAFISSLYSARFRYMTIAVLHDVMEDLDIDFDDIDMMFGTAVASRLVYLTNKGGNKNYLTYLDTLLDSSDKMLPLIKLLDIADNLNRVENLPQSDKEFLVKKYVNARQRIYDSMKKQGYADITDYSFF